MTDLLAREHVTVKEAARRRRKAARAQAAANRKARRAAVAERSATLFGPKGLPGPAGGRWSLVDKPVEYRATTNQACGIWPWVVGAGTPVIGTYLGQHVGTSAPVCFDPLSWFHRANLLSNPSAFVLGLPGLGKSTLIRKMVTGSIAGGVTPMILGDLKPDYAEQVALMGGQVVRLGRGQGHLNPLAVGALGSILPILKERGFDAEHERVKAEVLSRRLDMTASLLALVRKDRPVTDTEEAVIARALELLDADPAFGPGNPPLLADLLGLLSAGHADLLVMTESEGLPEYHTAVKPLRLSMRALIEGPLGTVFSKQTSQPIDVGATAVCVDVSGISAGDKRLKAAVMLACWSDGFGAIEAAHTLADLGLGPQRHFLAVLDELWQVLGAGQGMVERVDALTRVNRTMGLALLMITHTAKDLESLASEADIKRAMGFIERSGAVFCGGLPASELRKLESVVSFTSREVAQVSSWSAPGTFDVQTGQENPPPGRGHFLLKVGSRPGIPFVTRLTASEVAAGFHNTNKRFTAAGEGTAGA
jgi:hypothetical protein